MVVTNKQTMDNTIEKKKVVYLFKNLLNRMNPLLGTKTSKRVGRGKGSGKGKTSGRGDKGQYARNQAPALRLIIKNLIRKLPKRGMAGKPIQTLELNTMQLKIISEKNNVKEWTTESLLEALNAPKKYKKLKIIHNNYIETLSPLTVQVDKISVNAKKFIEDNKGSVTLIEPKKVWVRKKYIPTKPL